MKTNERPVSAKHPESHYWDDNALAITEEFVAYPHTRRINSIRFSSGELFDTSVVSIECRKNSIVSVDID